MSQAQIELALFDKLETIKASLPTIYYPNSPNKNKPNPPTGEHIRVSILNAGTNALGIATTDQTLGIMQCLVLVKDGTGTIRAAQIADLILSAFARNTLLSNNVRIDKTGSVGVGFTLDWWYMLPVSINYQQIK
jgi:hypothetical protein